MWFQYLACAEAWGAIQTYFPSICCPLLGITISGFTSVYFNPKIADDDCPKGCFLNSIGISSVLN